jgi:FkbM family methyltransferase
VKNAAKSTLTELRARRTFGAERWREVKRLGKLPSYSSGKSGLLGFEAEYCHPQSFAGIYHQIYVHGAYRFEPGRPDPVILDCGANVGVSVAWFKQTWPASQITAFEADPVIAGVLRRNIQAGGFRDVAVVDQAVWIADEIVSFAIEGGDAGRLGESHTQVPATRLRDWLNEPVDLLKLDIEGAEIEVIPDCADALANVKAIVLEYHSLVGQPQRLGSMLEVLEDAGFRVWIKDEWIPTYPLVSDETRAGMDMRLNVFARR